MPVPTTPVLVFRPEHPGWFLLPLADRMIYKARGWGDGIGHFRTIAAEMQLYLLWPFVLGRRLGLTRPAMQWLGQRSYGLYLFHLPLLVFWQRLVYHLVPGPAGRALLMGRLPVLLAMGPVLLLLSAASWRWVEAPVDRFKNRFPYPQTAPPVPAPSAVS